MGYRPGLLCLLAQLLKAQWVYVSSADRLIRLGTSHGSNKRVAGYERNLAVTAHVDQQGCIAWQ